MPDILPDDTERTYVARCVPYVIGREGLEPAHAAAKCHGIWRQHLKTRSLEAGFENSEWFERDVLAAAFCPTGEGGGVDNSCGKNGKESSKSFSPKFTKRELSEVHGWDPEESDGIPRSYGGVLVNDDLQVLLREPKNHYDDYHWTWPKGTPDEDNEGNPEHPEKTAHREVLEETGYHTEIIEPIPGEYDSASGARFNPFIMQMLPRAKRVNHDEETQDTRWVGYNEARRLISQTKNEQGRERDLAILDKAYDMIYKLHRRGELGSPAYKLSLEAAFCPTGKGGGVDPTCSSHNKTVKGIKQDVKRALASVLEHTGYSRQQLKTGLSGSASPTSEFGRAAAKLRARVTGSVFLGGTEVKDAVRQLSTSNESLLTEITKGDAKKVIQELSGVPLYDLQCLSSITQHGKNVPGEARCHMAERRLEFSKDSRTGTYRHELGHAVRSMLGGESYKNKTQVTKAIAQEYEKVKAKVKADPAPKGVKLTHEQYEEKYGVAGRRSLDNWEENFAEHYRLYHRELHRDLHEKEQYGGKRLAGYRQRHPVMARIFDAHYTAALIGQELSKE